MLVWETIEGPYECRNNTRLEGDVLGSWPCLLYAYTSYAPMCPNTSSFWQHPTVIVWPLFECTVRPPRLSTGCMESL